MAPKKTKRESLREFALSMPDAWEDFPWGDTVAKVRKKIFVFLGEGGDVEHGITVKLDESHEEALAVDGAVPSGYGLGRAGWVTMPIKGRSPSIGVLRDWIEESYRLVAPKTLVRELDDRA